GVWAPPPAPVQGPPGAPAEGPAAPREELLDPSIAGSDVGGDGGGRHLPPAPLPMIEEPLIPLDEPTPEAAAEALAAMPMGDGSTLNPDIDFSAEPEPTTAAAVTEPFVPLTDLDLLRDAEEPAPP